MSDPGTTEALCGHRLPGDVALVSVERVVPLTVAQVLALADAMADRHQALVLTQAGLGLRIGELLGIRVADVDFLRRTVRIEHQAHGVTRKLVPPKTESSRRTIPLPQTVADALAAHLAAYPAGPDIECTCPPDAKCSRVASGLLFHTAAGTALDQDYYGHRVLSAAITKANTAIRKTNATAPKGTEPAPELPTDTTSHDLRHHAVRAGRSGGARFAGRVWGWCLTLLLSLALVVAVSLAAEWWLW